MEVKAAGFGVKTIVYGCQIGFILTAESERHKLLPTNDLKKQRFLSERLFCPPQMVLFHRSAPASPGITIQRKI